MKLFQTKLAKEYYLHAAKTHFPAKAYLYLCYSDIDPTSCPVPSALPNADVIIEDVVPYRSVITVTCHVGFKFGDGGTSRSFVCVENGKWSSAVDEGCTRMLHLYYAFLHSSCTFRIFTIDVPTDGTQSDKLVWL